MELKIIAHIRTDFPEKFGIPRQSGLVGELEGRVVFEPAYRSEDAVRGLEDFDYIWLLWAFEGTERAHFTATVTPPRLGGRQTMGVFATRSPFRPNPIGLSSVRLVRVEHTEKEGPVLVVAGADLRDNTPVYDVKPYLAYTDSHPDAREGFAGFVKDYALKVDFPARLLDLLPEGKRRAALALLAQDPRPAYHDDDRRYGVAFAGFDIHFHVKDGVLTVCDLVPLKP
ncbi:MAG: tRNA (N6-threonylcarbamoyladenosine(37)-N6)-methyltransferase TrmO [Eubacteriales bacterium]